MLFSTLCLGGKLVLAPSASKDDIAELVGLVDAEAVTHLLCVPSLYSVLLDHPKTRSLETVIVAGEECLPELVERHASSPTAAQLFNEYGPTEATVWSSVQALTPKPGSGPVSIGRPIDRARIHLMDARGRRVPPGCAGELHIAGPGLTRGYVGRPAATAAAFVPDPLAHEPGDRLYRTGDLARRMAGGELVFLGRIDRQVKVRGFRIELGEIESVLQTHDAVREAAVVVVGTDAASQRIVAYLVLSNAKTEPELADLRRHLRQQLPDFMVPGGFVFLEAMPLTPNGKVDRRALLEAGGEQLVRDVPFVAPRTATEETLVGIWHDLLGLEQIGVEDNFFDLGGHSLLTTQLVSRLRDAFGLDVPLQSFFEEPTIAGLAESIDIARWATEAADQRSVDDEPDDDLEMGEL